MPKLSPAQRARLREIATVLRTLDLDRPYGLREALPELRLLTGLDHVVCMRPVARAHGWSADVFELANVANASRFKQKVLGFLAQAPMRFASFDALRPEREQRNVVIDPVRLLAAGEYEHTRAYREVMRPLGLHLHSVARALVCEGASLLAWFGGFHADAITEHHRGMLAAILPIVRQRLALERRVADGIGPSHAIVLDAINAPAMIVGAGGELHEVNHAAHALVVTQWDDVHTSLRARLGGSAAALAFELSPLSERGTPARWLAVLRPRTAGARLAQAIATAATRWKLSPRRRRVLELLVRGETTMEIATALGVTERAVELHVTALFDRAGVENRASLIAAALLGG